MPSIAHAQNPDTPKADPQDFVHDVLQALLKPNWNVFAHTGYATNFAVPGSHSVRAYTVRASGFTTVRVAFTRGADEYAVAVATAKRTNIDALQRALAATVSRVAGT